MILNDEDYRKRGIGSALIIQKWDSKFEKDWVENDYYSYMGCGWW